MINSVRNTVLSILNKNNFGYLSPADFNLYAKQAQLEIFDQYFYDYNYQINKENIRQSGTGYADIARSLEEVIDTFSTIANFTTNTFALQLITFFLTDFFLREATTRWNRCRTQRLIFFFLHTLPLLR